MSASDPAVRTWNGDLVVRVLPGQGESRFTLYDGTQLHWTGAALEVTSNPGPRTIDVRVRDQKPVVTRLDGPSTTITPSDAQA